MDISSVKSWLVEVVTTGNGSAGGVASPAGVGAAQSAGANQAVKLATPSVDQVVQSVGQLNDSFEILGVDLKAFIEKDADSGVNVVKVVEKGTTQLIRQFPYVEIVVVARALNHLSGGKAGLLRTDA